MFHVYSIIIVVFVNFPPDSMPDRAGKYYSGLFCSDGESRLVLSMVVWLMVQWHKGIANCVVVCWPGPHKTKTIK